jgi:predicted transcriptional regulator
MGVIPRALIENVKHFGLSGSEIDFVLKLLAFNMNGVICPTIQALSARSGTSEKTYQRAAEELQRKGLITKIQQRGENWKLGSNNYDLSLLWNAVGERVVGSRGNQLSIFSFSLLDSADWSEDGGNSILSRFWESADTVLERGWAFFPRAIDTHQKVLSMSSFESVILKYLFMYADSEGVSSVSFTKMNEHLGFSKTKIVNSLQKLSLEGLIHTEHSTKFGRKLRNRYNLKPLVKKLEDLERVTVQTKLEGKGQWRDYSSRSIRSIKATNPTQAALEKKRNSHVGRVKEIDAEISNLKSHFFSKESEEASLIRVLESERSEILGWSTGMSSLKEILAARMKSIPETYNSVDPVREEAQNICRRLRGNWSQNKRFYMKVVRNLGTTIDRFVASSNELWRNPERYFISSISKEMRRVKS